MASSQTELASPPSRAASAARASRRMCSISIAVGCADPSIDGGAKTWCILTSCKPHPRMSQRPRDAVGELLNYKYSHTFTTSKADPACVLFTIHTNASSPRTTMPRRSTKRPHWQTGELCEPQGQVQTKKSKDARSYAPPNTSSQGVTGARGRRSNARTPRCPPPPTRPARRQRRAQAPSAMSSSSAFFSSSSSSSSGNWKLPRSR